MRGKDKKEFAQTSPHVHHVFGPEELTEVAVWAR
jgi:hypothetical protein